jgi:hydroxyacylglutathione hydrolase
MITVKTFIFNEFQENTYLLIEDSGLCKVIDPGMNSDAEREQFDQFIASNKLRLEAIINTHCHVDHVMGCQYLKRKYALPFYIHKLEISMLGQAVSYGNFFGIEIDPPPPPDFYLNENEGMEVGTSQFKIIHVPGHSEGSVAFYNSEQEILITGDVLFKGSIGRTDLTGGNYATLINSIKSKIMSLPGNTLVLPGHGVSTTIEAERMTNPFLV